MNSETKFAEIYKDIEYFLYQNGYAVATQTIQKVFELGKIDSISIMEKIYHEQNSKLEGIFIIGEENSPNEISISLQREEDLNQMLFEQKNIIEASIFALVPRSENNSFLKIMNDQYKIKKFMKLFQKKQNPITGFLSQQKKRQWLEEQDINFSSLQNPALFEEHKSKQIGKEQSTGQKKFHNINSRKKFNFENE